MTKIKKQRETKKNSKPKEPIEEIQIAKQTYIEDTFDVDEQKFDEKIIVNEIKKKTTKTISKNELYKLLSFQNK